jgi:uncharacterized membrane protein YgcG
MRGTATEWVDVPLCIKDVAAKMGVRSQEDGLAYVARTPEARAHDVPSVVLAALSYFGILGGKVLAERAKVWKDICIKWEKRSAAEFVEAKGAAREARAAVLDGTVGEKRRRKSKIHYKGLSEEGKAATYMGGREDAGACVRDFAGDRGRRSAAKAAAHEGRARGRGGSGGSGGGGARGGGQQTRGPFSPPSSLGHFCYRKCSRPLTHPPPPLSSLPPSPLPQASPRAPRPRSWRAPPGTASRRG